MRTSEERLARTVVLTLFYNMEKTKSVISVLTNIFEAQNPNLVFYIFFSCLQWQSFVFENTNKNPTKTPSRYKNKATPTEH